MSKKLHEALLHTNNKYIGVSKCDERNVVEVCHANKKNSS